MSVEFLDYTTSEIISNLVLFHDKRVATVLHGLYKIMALLTSSSVQVQGTNDNSIVSKLSMINLGYEKDEYLNVFVKKPQRRSPLINRGYYIRCKAVRHAVNKFLGEIDGRKQIISLGAGFDTTYFVVGKKNEIPNNMFFVEIDYPDVLNTKIQLAIKEGLFSGSNSLATSQVVLRQDNYLAIGFDLRHIGSQLFDLLRQNDVDFAVPTLFLSEVVLTYLTSSQSSRVLSWVDHYFRNAFTLVFEQMLPDDAFGHVMCRHFQNIGSPLLSIRNYSTLESQKQRHSGFGLCCSAVDLQTFYNNLPLPERQRIDNLELFDEYEGWNQMCLHYFCLCSTNSTSPSLVNLCREMIGSNTSAESYDSHQNAQLQNEGCVEHMSASLQVYGHAMAANAESDQVIYSIHPRFLWLNILLERALLRENVACFTWLAAVVQLPVTSVSIGSFVGYLTDILTSSSEIMKHNLVLVELQTDHHMMMVFVLGGFGIPCSVYGNKKVSHRRLQNIYKVDLRSCSISECRLNDEANLSHLMFSSVVHCKSGGCDLLVLFGGRTSPKHCTNRVKCIEIIADSKQKSYLTTTVKCVSESIEAPSGRWRHSSIVVPALSVTSSSHMIVTGGRDLHNVFSDCWTLNLADFTWKNLCLKPKSLEKGPDFSVNDKEFPPRHSHSSTFWIAENTIVISGGLDESSKPHNDVVCLKISDQSEASYERLKITPPLTPRYSHTSHIANDELLLLVGGVIFPDSHTHHTDKLALQDNIAIVNLNTSSWIQTVLFPVVHLSEPLRIHCHTSVLKSCNADNELELLVFGGGSNCFSFGTAFNQSPFRFSFRLMK